MTDGFEAHGLGKRYRRRQWALRDVDVSVPAGSITALVGPNGAGKSTLIKAGIGFERPTAGRVFVDGVDPWKERGRAIRRVGYVPQSPSLYRELTVDDHVRLAATLRRGFDVDLARRRLDQLAIPLTSRADELSGGQQAQVGLALALGTRAPVLLLDEPLASLDPLARREFLHVLVDAVRADGATALLSSHVITDIEQACDRLLVLGWWPKAPGPVDRRFDRGPPDRRDAHAGRRGRRHVHGHRWRPGLAGADDTRIGRRVAGRRRWRRSCSDTWRPVARRTLVGVAA